MGKIKEFLFDIAEDIVTNFLDIDALIEMDDETKEDAIYGVVEEYIQSKEEQRDYVKSEFARANIEGIISFIIEIVNSSDENLYESISEKEIAYDPNKNLIRIYRDYEEDFKELLKQYKIQYSTFWLDSTYGGDGFMDFKFNNPLDYQRARKISRELFHIAVTEEIDYDAIARRNRDRDKETRFVGGYTKPITPRKPIINSEEDYIDSPSVRQEYKELVSKKEESQSDFNLVNVAMDDLMDMELNLKAQIARLKNIKKNSEATKLKNEIESKVKEIKDLRSEVKKAWTKTNNDLIKTTNKINKILLKAQRGKTLD